MVAMPNFEENAPVAPVHPTVRERHGRRFVDDYEWLRDKESEETLDYLRAENAYTDAQTAGLRDLREEIFTEIKSRTQETDMSVPERAGGYWYYARTIEGKSYPVACRRALVDGEDPWVPPTLPEPGSDEPVEGEEIVLDLNALAEGNEFFSTGAMAVTLSGRYLAYSVDTSGDERFELFVKDLQTGKLLDDHLTGVFYGATWAGESHIFYLTVDDAWRPDTVWRHRVGTPQSEDVKVFHEPDGKFNVDIGLVRSEKFLLIQAASKITSEVWALPAAEPEGEFECLWGREEGVEYDVDHAVVPGRAGGEDRWIVTHNKTAENFVVADAPAVTGADLPPLEDLEVLVGSDEDTRVEGVDCYRDFLTVGFRRGGIGRGGVVPIADGGYGELDEIEFDEELYTLGIAGNAEWDAPVIRLFYGSFTTPAEVYDYEVATGKRRLLKRRAVLGDFDREDYVAYRLWTTARDGEEIPVSVLHRRDLDTSTPQPAVLYGYGSYEAPTDPGFSIARLSQLDRGMMFIVAHVRGGGELGRRWYTGGKLRNKKNTFYDFIDVADDLIDRGITAPNRLVAEGGSAGGMLMGAVANLAGDRFAGIEAVVPFVDPLTSMLMPELPLTITEWDEWGDPYHDAGDYDYMASYAPYENVEAKDYPDILAVTSLNDTRVLYVEPAKWIARLRATATGGRFLLKTEMSAGHGGVSGRYERWKQTAFEFAWQIAKATAYRSR